MRINLKELLRDGLNKKKAAQMAKEFGIDKKVFSFLIENSTKPSIEAGMKQISQELGSESRKASAILLGTSEDKPPGEPDSQENTAAIVVRPKMVSMKISGGVKEKMRSLARGRVTMSANKLFLMPLIRIG